MKTTEQTIKEIEKEIAEDLLNDLQNFETLEDFVQSSYNSDYYIIGIYHAKKWLNEKDVFNCIEIVTEYQEEQFGETVFQDIFNPELLCTYTVYCVAESFIQEICLIFNIEYFEELEETEKDKISNFLKNYLK